MQREKSTTIQCARYILLPPEGTQYELEEKGYTGRITDTKIDSPYQLVTIWQKQQVSCRPNFLGQSKMRFQQVYIESRNFLSHMKRLHGERRRMWRALRRGVTLCKCGWECSDREPSALWYY